MVCAMPTEAPAPAPIAPPSAAFLAASFLLLPQPLIVPSSSVPVLAHGPAWPSSRAALRLYLTSSGVTTWSRTTRISALPLMRPGALTKATWPSTRLPAGMISLPSAVIGFVTSPVNGSPVLLVLDVSVVVKRIWSRLPAGILANLVAEAGGGAWSAHAASAGRTAAASTPISVILRVRFSIVFLPGTGRPKASRDTFPLSSEYTLSLGFTSTRLRADTTGWILIRRLRLYVLEAAFISFNRSLSGTLSPNESV